jgi:hypothetical protein
MQRKTLLGIATMCIMPLFWFLICFFLWDIAQKKGLEDGLTAACIAGGILSVIAIVLYINDDK